MEYIEVPPEELERDEAHARSESESDEALRRSIEDGIIVQPILARKVDGEIRVFDGMRRVDAAIKVGKDEVPVILHEDLSDRQALIDSFTINGIDAFEKTVHDNDRQLSLKRAANIQGVDVEDIETELGIRTEEDVLFDKIGGIYGVGKKTCERLIQAFESAEDVQEANVEELSEVPQVGVQTAHRISEHDPSVTEVYVPEN